MHTTIDSLSHKLSSYLDPGQIQQVRRAYLYAEQAHDGQRRHSGEAYISHPLAVAGILANMHMDHQSLAAAMLHDVIEDTAISKQALSNQFGETIAELVDGVSKLAHINFDTHEEKQAENFQKMALAMARDIRVILVKLADRLHNMRTLGVLAPEKSRRIAKETLEIYAPIAHRLGINDMRIEFQDRGFAALYPLRAARLQAALRKARGNRRELVDKIQESIELRLEREGINALVIGREKHLYSIYYKMREKQKSFKDIMDVYAFRIIVENVDTCYRVLGAIHNLYKPVVGEFNDYIAIPKKNGYQSLHTVLVGMHGVPIEVQIRTKEMDEMANTGIAAHWLYKTDPDQSMNPNHARARQWITGLLEMQQRSGNPLEFIKDVKMDLFPDEVYVFTPKGKIIELPAGATPVDFAYAVHTDIGHACVACRIDNQYAPLSSTLKSGQKIHIVTSPTAQPNPAWLDYVVTAKARSAIRHFLKHQRHNQSIELGRRLLDKSLAGFHTNLENFADEKLQQLAKEAGMDAFDQLVEQIGLGKRLAYPYAKMLVPEQEAESGGATPLLIDAPDGMLLSYARCCRPIPGDHIVGHMSTGKGLVIHRQTCKNVQDLQGNPDKLMPAAWSPEVKGEFSVDMRVEVFSERGVIAALATRITEQGANIEQIHVDEKDPQSSVIRLQIGVANRFDFAQIMKRIRKLPFVIRVSRQKN